MKALKKRSAWQVFLWGLRHPVLWNRMIAIQEFRRKRVLREYIEWDYKVNKKEYDRQFEREWRKELREMNRPKYWDTSVFPHRLR